MEDLEVRLVQDNWVSLDQLNYARQHTYKTGKSIWFAMLQLGYSLRRGYCLVFCKRKRHPICDHIRLQDQKDVLVMVDEFFCMQNLVMPLFRIQHTLFVACSNPFNTGLLDSLSKKTGLLIEPLIATAHSILAAIELYWHLDDRVFEAGKYFIKQSTVHGVSLWRSSERLSIKLPVSVRVEDDFAIIHPGIPLEGVTQDISNTGNSIGIVVPIYLPQGLKIHLDIETPAKSGNAKEIFGCKGEIVNIRLEGLRSYFLGVKLLEIEDKAQTRLLELVVKNK